MALAQRGVFRIGPHGRQALAWEVLSDGGPAIVEKYGGLNNASAYIGMMPGHSLGIVIRGSIPTKIGRCILLDFAGIEHASRRGSPR